MITRLGRSPREGNGNPLQYSCLGNLVEPGGLQSMGLQKGQIRLTKQQQHTRNVLEDMSFLGRKVLTNLDSILKSRDITLPTKVCLVKAMVFLVVTYDVRIGL